MAQEAYEPAGIELQDSKATFVVHWSDARTTRIPYRDLRLACRCATCVEELTGRPLLDPASVPADVGVVDCRETGLYGVQIEWTDRHRTGIYTWPRLRELGELRDRP